MPRKSQPDYFVAISSGVYKVDGKVETIIEGRTIVGRDAAIYRAYPQFFKAVERPAIEAATAAPGQQR